MDKLILIFVCVALLTSHVTSETTEDEESEIHVLPKVKDLFNVEDDSLRREQQYLISTLPTNNESTKFRNNSNMNNNIGELQPVPGNSETENEPSTSTSSTATPTTESINNRNSENKVPPVFIDFQSDVEHKSDVNNSTTSSTNKNANLLETEISQLKTQYLPLENRSVDDHDDGEDKSGWFYEEKNDDDDEDYTENEASKDDSEEYKDEGDDIVLGEHNNDDDDDEEYDVTKWTQHDDDVNDRDWDGETEDDFDESKNQLADELGKKNKQPTAPTRMVLFYTWMILAVLLIIIGVSTYQSRCRGFRFFGRRASNAKDDRKRLVEHEFV